MNPTATDTNFDDRSDRFGERIYGSIKGRLRLELVWRDLLAQWPALSASTPLHCLDAGAGQGQFSARLLAQGHTVMLADTSAKMLATARHELGNVTAASFYQGSLQSLAQQQPDQTYDLVACHAVLEWLAEPLAMLPLLQRWLKPGGCLSLLFYNRNGLIINDMVKGNYKKLMTGNFGGTPGGLTPPNPLQPEAVIIALEKLGLQILSRRGIRCAWDLLRKELRTARAFDDVLELEWQYGNTAPFWQMGRYVHLLVKA